MKEMYLALGFAYFYFQVVNALAPFGECVEFMIMRRKKRASTRKIIVNVFGNRPRR